MLLCVSFFLFLFGRRGRARGGAWVTRIDKGQVDGVEVLVDAILDLTPHNELRHCCHGARAFILFVYLCVTHRFLSISAVESGTDIHGIR